jgi:hypothetical protein
MKDIIDEVREGIDKAYLGGYEAGVKDTKAKVLEMANEFFTNDKIRLLQELFDNMKV